MAKWKTIEYDVCSAYACFIEYGDESGLEPGESEMVTRFLERELNGVGPVDCHHWVIEFDESGSFGRCEIMGFRSDLMRLTLVFRPAVANRAA